MSGKSKGPIGLRSLSEIESAGKAQAQEGPESLAGKITVIPLDKLIPHPQNPRTVMHDEEMKELIGLISEAGQQEPLHVRPLANGEFQIISGHRRHHALSFLKEATAKVIIRDDLANDYDAIIAMVDLNAKADLKPSELAKAVQLRMDAMERKRGRPTKEAENHVHGEHDSTPKGTVRKQVAEEMKLPETTVQRLSKVPDLVPEMVKMLDKGDLALAQASNLAELKPEEQKKVHTFMEANEVVKPSQKQAAQLKILSKEGALSETKIKEVLKPKMEKAKEWEVKFKSEELEKLFDLKDPAVTPKTIKDFMWNATAQAMREKNRNHEKNEKHRG